MTRTDATPSLSDLNLEVSTLIAKFGRWKAFLAVVQHLLKPKGQPPDAVNALNTHLRKDIGLPPEPPTRLRWMPPKY
ncbi:hypothetical protein NBRC116601_20240 [Cognatishimia sp. WU-CL00825]|uniref:hypothetical protein n=1 Tax=Cognatishimia sp. WU-CL00825 TaxID=3127658 RepID=UPI003109F450